MYDLLELYAKPYDPKRPVVCVDEKSKQLLAHARTPISAKTGTLRKEDYEYERRGTRNIFLAIEPKAGKRCAKVTLRRQKSDFATFTMELAGTTYRDADHLDIVADNLNTHFEKSFLETFGPERAQEILSRITFHYTPKHASWLNMAEIEIGILDKQCLGKRMENARMLKREVGAWQARRNRAKVKIAWKFTKQDADRKLGKHYI